MDTRCCIDFMHTSTVFVSTTWTIHTQELLHVTSEMIQSIILAMSKITPSSHAFSLRPAQSLPLTKHSSDL